MENFFFGIGIGIKVILGGLLLISPIIFIYILAKFNIFFGIVEEGQAKAIMKFGEFEKLVMSYKGYRFDLDWNVIPEDAEDVTFQPKSFRIGGLFLIGIPFVHSVYKYRFDWISFEQGEKDEKLTQKVVGHSEVLDYIYVKEDVYYTSSENTETKGMVPVNAKMLLTIGIVNPYKALFRIQDWLEATLNEIKPALRQFINAREFEELIRIPTETTGKLGGIFLEESDIDEDQLKSYGVNIRSAGFVDIDPSGERGKEYMEAASKRWEAEKESERIDVIADATVSRITKEYGAITSFGPEGITIRLAEAFEVAGKGPSNFLFPLPIGSIQPVIEKLLGKKEDEDKKDEDKEDKK